MEKDEGLRAKIAEAERKLEEERMSRAQLESESILAKLAASQESARHQRDGLIIKHQVAVLEHERITLKERVDGLQAEVLEWKRKYGQVEAGALRVLDEKEKAADEVGRLKAKIEELEASLSGMLEVTEGFKERSVEMERKRGDLGRAVTLMEDVRKWMRKVAGDIAGGKAQGKMKEEDMEIPMHEAEDDEVPVSQRIKKLKEGGDPPIQLQTPSPPANSAPVRRSARSRSGLRSGQ